jgi:hypothetical protein
VDAATVTVKSLDSSVPFSISVESVMGSYVLNGVPEDINLEVLVTKQGHTTRRRVHTLSRTATGKRNILNFGGKTTVEDDAKGPAYFISDYPEVASVSLSEAKDGVDPAALTFSVVLSEALDADSREAFERAFTIVPASPLTAVDETGAPTGFVDVVAAEIAAEGADSVALTQVDIGDFGYSLKKDDAFLGSYTNRLRVSWNAEGTEAKFTFSGNLKSSTESGARYQAALFYVGEDIEDAKGNVLGTYATGSFSSPAVGDVLCNVFKSPELTYDGAPGEAWAQTHTSAIGFAVERDDADPKLTGVNVVEDGADTRIELTFSEPMGAYVGSGRAFVDSRVSDLKNFSFMVGRERGSLRAEELYGSGETVVVDQIDRMKSQIRERSEFVFARDTGGAVGGNTAISPPVSVAVEVDPDAPAIVNVLLRGCAGLFADFRQIKARASGVADPAGRVISTREADENLVSASM